MRAQLSVHFASTVLIVLLVALTLFTFLNTLKTMEQRNQMRTSAMMTAARVAAGIDVMFRDLCYNTNCSANIVLPPKIRAPGSGIEANYSLSFNGTNIVLSPDGYEPVVVSASRSLDGLHITVLEEQDRKVVVVEGS
jgi:hypothetical protein